MHDENVRFAVGAGGGLGHLAVQYAAAMGMRVVAVDMPDKRDFCLSLGAELVFDATDKGLVDDVSTSTGPELRHRPRSHSSTSGSCFYLPP